MQFKEHIEVLEACLSLFESKDIEDNSNFVYTGGG